MISRNFFIPPEPSAVSCYVGRFVVVGLVAAYAAVVSLKAAGLLPPTVTWAGVALVPAAWFLALAAMAILPARFPQRPGLMIGVGLLCLLAAFASVYWQTWT